MNRRLHRRRGYYDSDSSDYTFDSDEERGGGPQGSFCYSPLEPGQIRLMVLHPGDENARPKCSLLPVFLNDPDLVPYEALSYVWGRPRRHNLIECSSTQSPSSANIGITDNLLVALKHLQLPDCRRTIWVDSVCINQEDIGERGSQVRLMTEIYSKAQTVFIWLGTRLKGHYRYSAEEPSVFDIDPSTVPMDGPASEHHVFRDQRPELKSIVRSTWFERAWVFQEVVVASKARVYLGGKSIDWDVLCRMCEIVAWSGSIDDFSVINGMQTMRRLHLKGSSGSQPEDGHGKKLTLRYLLEHQRSAKSTDPRDKVFSLLGVARDDFGGLVRADYTLSIRDVYIAVAKHLSRETGEGPLDFLSAVQIDGFSKEVPSWVPDWTRSPLQYFNLLQLSHRTHAAGDTTASISYREIRLESSDSVALVAKGLRIQTIQSSAPFIPRGGAGKEVTYDLVGEMLKQFDDPYPITGQEYVDAYSFAIEPTLEFDWSSKPDPETPGFWDQVNEYATKTLGPDYVCKTEHWYPRGVNLWYRNRDKENRFVFTVSGGGADRAKFRRKFFVTNSGFMGIGPERLEDGDEVCILGGGRMPYLIRREREFWKFVGEAYIHGIMDGQALQGKKTEAFEELVFI